MKETKNDKLFSEIYKCEDCHTDILKKAYYLGAYCKAVIDGSFYSRVSEGNTTFKKWLSNQIINAKNLNKIYSQASHFEDKLQLVGKQLEDLSFQVTSYTKPSTKSISQYEVSYFFRKGFNEFIKFKKEQKESSQKGKQQN
ncbi:MAG TPA: hypothetical protein EYG85_05835 [Crocinitomix sp.]|nr:hypothetical protein [Crocinitomix sp.]